MTQSKNSNIEVNDEVIRDSQKGVSEGIPSLDSESKIPLSQIPIGVEAFFLNPRGLIGTGGGWADEGIIGVMPVILFSSSQTEQAVYGTYAMSRFVFTDVDPEIGFVTHTSTAPGVGTEDVRWQLDLHNIADLESNVGSPTQTILLTQTLVTTNADTKEGLITFNLDRTLMEDQDDIVAIISRLGGDVLDTYTGDIGIGQSGLGVETSIHNA